jgi:hypothetical protein
MQKKKNIVNPNDCKITIQKIDCWLEISLRITTQRTQTIELFSFASSES